LAAVEAGLRPDFSKVWLTTAMSASGEKGLVMMFTTLGMTANHSPMSSPLALMTMTGISARVTLPEMARQTSSPFKSGSKKSSRIRSGGCACAAAMPSSPVNALSTR
jgi:hypothetical protein